MAEEQRLQEPGCHRLCANNCGFFGSPTTLNLCSKCYKNYCLKEQQFSEAKLAVEKTIHPESYIHPLQNSHKHESKWYLSSSGSSVNVSVDSSEAPVAVETVGAVQPNRCSTCRRRVGLTGFICRCGTIFCGSHRYPEQHDCTFDFKALGREEIAKANPVIKAEKLEKI